MFFQVLLLVILFLSIYYFYHKNLRMIRYLKQIEGPPDLPFIGNFYTILTCKKEEIWPTIEKLNQKYFPIWRMWGAHIGGVVFQTPEDIEVLLSSPKHIEKSLFYKFLSDWLHDGLLLSTGTNVSIAKFSVDIISRHKWFHRRKLLTPAFHFNVLKKYVDVMKDQSEKLVKSLNSTGESQTVNLIPFLTKYTLNVICGTALGTDMNKYGDKTTENYKNAVYDMGEVIVHRFLKMWLSNNFLFRYFTPTGWRSQKTIRILHDFTTKIIKERMEYHKQSDGAYLKNVDSTVDSPEESDLHMGVPKKRMAMLDILISSYMKKEIDELGIREEVDTFVFEGHDTSAMALTFCIQLLAEHQEIQAKAREEIDSIWETMNGQIHFNELNKMVYLERCVKESLRLYPSVPFISRHLNEDINLNGKIVPRGAIAVVLIYDLQRDPRIWKDPLKFDPDRFLPEQILNRHPYAYIPFSAGPRNCIGQKFALMELKMFLTYILHHFDLECVEHHADFVRDPDIILRITKDVHVKFIPRH